MPNRRHPGLLQTFVSTGPLFTGGLLAWIPPLACLGFAEYALNEAGRNPWTWPVRPQADRGAWICAALVLAAGLAATTLRGPRTTLTDNLRITSAAFRRAAAYASGRRPPRGL